MAETGIVYKPEVLILCGLPASGKTRRAMQWVAEDNQHRTRINYDDLRIELFGLEWKWNRADEDRMQEEARNRFDNALQLGMSVVIDNTNLSKKVRDQWVARAARFGVIADVEEVSASIFDCVKRDYKRPSRVGRAVIDRMALFHGWIDWKDREVYPYDGFVVCDVDGTLADTSRRAHFMQQKPKDWKGFFANVADDPIHHDIADLLETLAADNYGILIVSGRPIDQTGIATEDWLIKHGIKYDHLFMRNGGDHRPDTEVKREILDLLPIDDIAYVLDDRDSVVKMWRSAGLRCLQVAPGAF